MQFTFKNAYAIKMHHTVQMMTNYGEMHMKIYTCYSIGEMADIKIK